MELRRLLSHVNDPNHPAHGVISTALVAGLTLVDPRPLTTGRRLVYRGAVAALTAWTVAVSLRSADEIGVIPPAGRAAITVGAAGAALGVAEAGEALDARMHDRLARSGARRPRVWLAAGGAVLSLAAWWLGRLSDSAQSAGEDSEPEDVLIELPDDVRTLAERVLSATDAFGAPELRAQLAQARLIDEREEPGATFWPSARLHVPDGSPRAVPGEATFPVIGRFRALDDRTFDLRVLVVAGRLDSLHVEESADWTSEDWDGWYGAGRDLDELGAWPAPDGLELLIETKDGWSPAP